MPQRKAFLLFIFTAVILTLPWISHDFASKGEPREALSAKYIYESGDWILPFRYDSEFATKPPLLHWLIAGTSIPLGGVSEFSSRLPSVIFSILSLSIFIYFLLPYCKPSTALLTVLITLTSAEWYRASISARVDMALSASLLIAFLSFYKYYESSFKCRLSATMCIIFLSVASLTKGPIGFILPGLLFFIFLWRENLPFTKIILKLLPLTIIPAFTLGSWYLAAYNRGGDRFLDVVINENLGRFLGEMNEELGGAHKHSAFYLYGTLLLGLLPWTFILFNPGILLVRWSNLKYPLTLFKNFRFSSINFYFFLITFGFILFFSFPESKRGVYLLPVYPFISYFLAQLIEYLSTHHPSYCRKATAIFSTLIAAATLIILLVCVYGERLAALISGSKSLAAYKYLLGIISSTAWSTGAFTVGLIVFLVAVINICLKKSELLIPLFIGTIMLTSLSLVQGSARAYSAKPLSNEIRTLGILTKNTYSFSRDYGLNFYLGGRLKDFNLDKCQSENSSFNLLIKEEEYLKSIKTLKICGDMKIIHKSEYPVEKFNNKYYILSFF